jgi:hypothetical protein
MFEQVHEEVVGQRLRPLGKDAVLGLSEVGLQYAHAADENRHLGRGQRETGWPGPAAGSPATSFFRFEGSCGTRRYQGSHHSRWPFF